MTPPPPDASDRPIAALLAPDLLVLLDDSPGSVAEETEEMHPRDLASVVEAIPENRVAELLAALAEVGVNVEMISYGWGSINVSMVIDDREIDRAVKALHGRLFERP